ncbi:DNA helicase [Tanacetum coccineum]
MKNSRLFNLSRVLTRKIVTIFRVPPLLNRVGSDVRSHPEEHDKLVGSYDLDPILRSRSCKDKNDPRWDRDLDSLGKTIILDSKFGGLGVGCLASKNLGLLGKWKWRFLTEDKALWNIVIKDFYGADGGFNLDTNQIGTGGIWPDIISVTKSIGHIDADFERSFVKKVNNGSDTLFWKDQWCCNGVRLMEAFPRLFALETHKDFTISDRWGLNNNEGGWKWAWRFPPRGRANNEFLESFKSIQKCYRGSLATMHESSKTKAGDEASGMGGDETPFTAKTKDVVGSDVYGGTSALQGVFSFSASSSPSSHDRNTQLYLDVFGMYNTFYGGTLRQDSITAFRVISRAQDAELYLDVFKKYSQCCGGTSRHVSSRTFTDPMSVATLIHNNAQKQKLYTDVTADPFRSYSSLCLANAGKRRIVHSPRIAPVSPLQLASSYCSSMFIESIILLSSSAASNHVVPSVSNPQKRTAANSQLMLTTAEASTSKPTRPLPSRNKNMSGRHSGESQRINRQTLAEACSSATTVGRSYTYVDLGDCTQRCRYCGASFWYGERLKGCSHGQRVEYHLCCSDGRIYKQQPPEPPEYIKQLFQNKHFMENIRAYNQMFAMTSFGAKIDESINAGKGPYVFKVSGQVYHWIGSLCPIVGETTKFLQLYIYDSENEVANSMSHFGRVDDSRLDPQIVEGLIHFLDAHNELVQLFRTARDKCKEMDILEFKIRLYNAEGALGYELPTSNTLGEMVFESGIKSKTNFDVIIEYKDGPLHRVNKLHLSYMSLQFPLLFIHGQSGYYKELKLRSADDSGKAKRVTMLAYYRYHVFCAVEQNRLDFIRKKQNDIRSDYLSGLYDAISRGEQDGYEVGGRIILPMSFTGGPRYMYAHYLDALAIFLFTVEFQKRGLPHCHTLLWVDSASKIRMPEQVDQFIFVELPYPTIDPDGYRVVSELMMHGLCGAANLKASCMKASKCSKNFPKKYNPKTYFDDNGHVHYQRRDANVSTTRHQFKLDNRYVVPYNRNLLLAFEAHINVEYCGWSMLIKYLFKYISKGTDRVFSRVCRPIGNSSVETEPSQQVVDVIQNYVEGRFICAHEAYWRIFKFDIHHREPVVQILAVHLEDMQRVTFRDRDRIESVVNLPGKKNTTLTEWFVYNASNQNGRHLTYLDFPSEFVWYGDSKTWSPR